MTTSEVTKQLEQALTATQAALSALNGLIVPHDYQDVTGLTLKSAAQMLVAARAFMSNDDVEALEAIEGADELLNGIYDIIDSELEDDEE